MMERALGVAWRDPAGRMLEYGRVVRALFDTGRAALDGAHYSVSAGLWIEPRPAVALIVGRSASASAARRASSRTRS